MDGHVLTTGVETNIAGTSSGGYNTINDGINEISSSPSNSTISIVGSDGINVTVSSGPSVGPDVINIKSALPNVLLATSGDGQKHLAMLDDTRSMKMLSVAEPQYVFSDSKLSNLSWMSIGLSSHANTAHIARYDATIVGLTVFCVDSTNNADIHLYVNNTDFGKIGDIFNMTNSISIINNIDIDIFSGDMVRLRVIGGGYNTIKDVVATLTVKWRFS